jgi:tRNA A37 threonylcarbamoyladenosine biosynthesis protein TsaE
VEEILDIGLLDYLGRTESGVVIIEWAEKILSMLPAERLQINFTVLKKNERDIELAAASSKFDHLFRGLRAS